MKELSIEDKAQRYDEAIEFAHNKHRFSSNLSEIKLIEELFPELRESEDSRIINNIKKAVESYWSDEPLHEILDWLEKRGEQKSAIKLERDDNGEAVLTPFEAELFSMMSEAWQGYSFGEEVNIAKIVKEHSKELLERANEQNPAWNEEDEYCLAGVIETELYMLDVVNGVKKFDVGNSSIKEECTRELDWLKSLKERVQQQPKQEWSEEDENLFRCAIDAVKQESKVRTDGCLDEEVGEMVTNWLKSLKVRYTWKPSDEQMESLDDVISSRDIKYDVLSELWKDLKKLRNE